MASAAAVRDHASPDLIKAVDRGDIPVSVAAGLATASEAIQRQAIAEPERAHVLVKQAARELASRTWGRSSWHGLPSATA